jgi:hypothetical protein
LAAAAATAAAIAAVATKGGNIAAHRDLTCRGREANAAAVPAAAAPPAIAPAITTCTDTAAAAAIAAFTAADIDTAGYGDAVACRERNDAPAKAQDRVAGIPTVAATTTSSIGLPRTANATVAAITAVSHDPAVDADIARGASRDHEGAGYPSEASRTATTTIAARRACTATTAFAAVDIDTTGDAYASSRSRKQDRPTIAARAAGTTNVVG